MPSQLQVWRQHGYKQVQQLKLCTYVTAEVPASLFWETENTIPTQGSCLLRIDSFQKKKNKKKKPGDAASNASTKKRHDSSHKSGGENETKTSATIIIGANPHSNSSSTEEESVEDAFQDSENSSSGEHRLFISQRAESRGHIIQSVCSIRTQLWPVDIGEPGFLLCWTVCLPNSLPKMVHSMRCFVFTHFSYRTWDNGNMYEEKRWMSRITALPTGTWSTTLLWRPLMGPCPCAGEHQMAYIPPDLVEEGASHQCWLQGRAPCRIRWWQSVIAVEVHRVLTGTEDKSVKGVDNMHKTCIFLNISSWNCIISRTTMD